MPGRGVGFLLPALPAVCEDQSIPVVGTSCHRLVVFRPVSSESLLCGASLKGLPVASAMVALRHAGIAETQPWPLESGESSFATYEGLYSRDMFGPQSLASARVERVKLGKKGQTRFHVAAHCAG